MKDDAPLPERVPKKRKQLEDASVTLDLHIAIWLSGVEITPSERRRLEAEKERRRSEARRGSRTVGVLSSEVGVRPEQIEALREALAGCGATDLKHVYTRSRVHAACKETGLPVEVFGTVHVIYPDGDGRAVIKGSDAVIALPHENEPQTYATTGVWSLIGFAKHRGVPVTIILPSGRIHEGATS